jgi:hypothetical protein
MRMDLCGSRYEPFSAPWGSYRIPRNEKTACWRSSVISRIRVLWLEVRELKIYRFSAQMDARWQWLPTNMCSFEAVRMSTIRSVLEPRSLPASLGSSTPCSVRPVFQGIVKFTAWFSETDIQVCLKGYKIQSVHCVCTWAWHVAADAGCLCDKAAALGEQNKEYIRTTGNQWNCSGFYE